MDRLERERMFVAVVEGGSFAAAAKRFGVSGGQVSKMVAGLEHSLHVQLLTRTTRALSLTEVGRAYHDGIKGLLSELDGLHAAVRDVSGTPVGRVRMTAPESFGRLRLLPHLLDFARRFPEIRLDIDLSDDLRNLVTGGYDAAVRVGHPSDSSLMARKLCEVGIVLVAAPDYLDKRGVPADPQDLHGHACIVDTNFRDLASWHFRAPNTRRPFTVAVPGGMLLGNGEACVAAAEAGFGVARVPDFVANEGLAANRLRRLLPEWEDRPFEVQAVYPPARYLAASVRVLIDFLAARLGRDGRGASRATSTPNRARPARTGRTGVRPAGSGARIG